MTFSWDAYLDREIERYTDGDGKEEEPEAEPDEAAYRASEDARRARFETWMAGLLAKEVGR
jgi:hypothetical protein